MNVKYNKKKSLKFILNYSIMFSVISKKMWCQLWKMNFNSQISVLPKSWNSTAPMNQFKTWLEPETSRSSFMCTSR